ncbi:ANK-REP-REGION domain-containing protein [Mycena venus]|uniref:ANK-REP-REGION domain-containing protein n=1 Tax=Mycena venus TaxID=2733690 RepID=A0A8H6U3G9_9AGAR|nr:ANK-REP-REGION domain-containing protein [Mycena venus]
MAMAHRPSESPTVNIKGGEGGPGGLGSGQAQGGAGGPGYGPTVNIGSATAYSRGGRNKYPTARHYHQLASPINFFLRQADISQMRVKGTGGWLPEDPVFKKWESGSGSTLWCHGIPGAGKTILVSMAVDHLSAKYRNNRDIGIAWIYLNHKEVESQTPSRLLAGLWRQLVLNRDIGSNAKELYQQHREKGTAPSLEEVVEVLHSSLKEFSKVFVIVDAMDEYSNESPTFQREILLQHLAEISSNVNLLITSRPNISPEPSSFPNLERLAQEDIQGYIDAQIKLSPLLRRHVQKQPMLQGEIHAKITSTVDGMFLLAKLHIASLSTKNSVGAV